MYAHTHTHTQTHTATVVITRIDTRTGLGLVLEREPSEQTYIISKILPDTAAAQAGGMLQPGDLVRMVDGRKVCMYECMYVCI